jgi:hypothetical protein
VPGRLPPKLLLNRLARRLTTAALLPPAVLLLRGLLKMLPLELWRGPKASKLLPPPLLPLPCLCRKVVP